MANGAVERVQRELEAANRQDVTAWAACYSVDATNHGRPAGRDGLRHIFQSLVAAFPDLHFELGQVVVDGEHVMCGRTLMQIGAQASRALTRTCSACLECRGGALQGSAGLPGNTAARSNGPMAATRSC